MRIFVSAAEISSDLQAEKILGELIALYPAGTVEISGIGGPRLRALPNFKTLEEAENLRAMGFTEVLGKLVTIRKILKRTVASLESHPPDIILTFDYPDFHFALLRACAKIPSLSPAVKICGIPPKVWVWRSKRIEEIRRLYHAVWVLFPFEKTLYENAGIPVIYEGNPLIADVVGYALLEKPEWMTSDKIKLAVMPGSREAEIKQHLKVIPETLQLLAEQTGKKMEVEIPVPAGIPIERLSQVLTNHFFVSYRFFPDGSREVLARNSIGLIKSGTSTLEATVLGCVPVIFYRVSLITRLIFQYLIRYEGAVGLPNILLGTKKRKDAIFPELLGPEASPRALCSALLTLINDQTVMDEKRKAGERLRGLLVPYSDIASRVAVQIKSLVAQRPGRALIRKRSFMIWIVSFLWSALNAFRRKLYDQKIFKSESISVPSILVGNLQAGGAGKTPLVIAIAKEAVRRGHRVGVVSRGYGGHFKPPFLLVGRELNAELREDAGVLGDEPAEILNDVPEVFLGLGKDRAQISKALIATGIDFLVFDDGFQNLKFKASKTVLVVSDARPDEVVFRDFLPAVKRADFVFQTKGLPRKAPVLARSLEWKVDALPDSPIWLLCGIADPDELAGFYRSLGVKIDRVISFADHAEYDLTQIRKICEEAQAAGVQVCVTPKDWVKLKTDNSLTIFVLRRKISSENWLEPLFKR